jgi:hypothetical protein
VVYHDVEPQLPVTHWQRIPTGLVVEFGNIHWVCPLQVYLHSIGRFMW